MATAAKTTTVQPTPEHGPAAPGKTGPADGYKWKVLAVVGAGVYMATLDSGIVNVALPVLTRDFGASLVLSQWVVLGYVLCITGLLLPAGRLADMLGRREVFLGGFLLFGGASALCGLAPSIHWLIAARVLQGVGGALVQANTGALLTQAFPVSERGRALGLNGSVVSAGLLSGPLIGGLITEYFGWRWAFYVNVPIAAI
ncbi:MAG: MFS transporter, partial [Chloroflexota bacterium]